MAGSLHPPGDPHTKLSPHFNEKSLKTNQVVIEFPTSYEYLRRFSDHLHLMLDGNIDQAQLDFDELC